MPASYKYVVKSTLFCPFSSFGFSFSCMKKKHALKEPGKTVAHLTVLVEEPGQSR